MWPTYGPNCGPLIDPKIRPTYWPYNIYIYVLLSYYLGQGWPAFVKNTIEIGVSAHLFEKKLRTQKFKGYYLGQVGQLCRNKLGSENNLYLTQIITLKNGIFAFSGPKLCAEMPIFTVLLEHQPSCAPKWAKKRYLFTFCKTQAIKKKAILSQPPTSPTIVFVFFNSSILKDRNIHVDQNTQLRQGKKQR